MTRDEERSEDVDPRLKSSEADSVAVESKEADSPEVRLPGDEGNEHLESG